MSIVLLNLSFPRLLNKLLVLGMLVTFTLGIVWVRGIKSESHPAL